MKKLLPLIVFALAFTLAQAQCVTNVNFNTWQQGGQPGNGNWSVQGGGSTVYQGINGDPTFFLSPNDLMNVHVTGNFRTIDSDNDWMGFVFSFLNPMTAIDTFDCWLFDWKQEQQGGASSGMSLDMINGVIPPSMYTTTFWNHQNTPEFTVVQNNFGSAGWQTGYNHAFELYLTYTRATIYVDGVQKFDKQGCFKPGRFGFYNYSQSDCIYSNFQYDLFVDFNFTPGNKICIGDTMDIDFVNPCSSGTLNYTSLTWDYGDGNTVTVNNPTFANANTSHVYAAPGNYNVTLTVTDIGGCTASKTRTITVAQPITLNVAGVQPLCNGGSNGSLTVSGSGGFGNYTYGWNGGTITGPNYVGATAGTYVVSATDGYCYATASYTLNQPPPLSASVSSTDASCNMNNGTASIVITGGTPPYSGTPPPTPVNWAGIPGTSVSGLAPGFYICDFIDFNGCSATLNYQGGSSVIQYTATINQLPCGYTLSSGSANQICGSVNDGRAWVHVTGGVAPIVINWSNGGSGDTINNLAPGNYSYDYTDGNSQHFTGTVTVNAAIPLLADLTTIGISCPGINDGQATASVTSGGITPYSYSWSGGQTGTPVVSGLSPGTVTVTITDGVGCSVVASDTVSGLPSLNITMSTIYDSCYHSGKGAAIADLSGGTPPYTYAWNNFSTDSANVNLIAGTYTLTVTDNKNCTASASAVVNGSPQFSWTSQTYDVKCYGDSTGVIHLSPSGGISPYTYTWSSGLASGSTPQTLPAGNYDYTITDSYNCTLIGSDTLYQPDTILIATSSHTNVTCYGSNNGTIALYIGGGTSPYTYQMQPIPGGYDTLTGLAAGTYSGTVVDSNGCSVSLSETITEPGPQSLTLTVTDNPCAGALQGTADANFVNATGSVTYTWNPGGVQPASLTGLASGVYSVTGTDANNCTQTATDTIQEPPAPVMSVTATDALCYGGNGSATANPSGGVAPYSYNWSSGGGNQQTVTPPAGNYTVSAADANGCNQTASFSINEPPQLTISETHVDNPCYGGTSGSVNVTVNGGTPSYTYAWAPNAANTTSSAQNLAAGVYTITATDSNSCSVSVSATVNQPYALSVSAIAMDALCYGQSTGEIDASASGGTSPYNYSASEGSNTFQSASGQFLNLSAAQYMVFVTDSNQCMDSTSATVGEPAQLSSVAVPTDVTCYHYTNGQLTVTAAGGTPGYTYTFSTGNQNSTGVENNLATGNYSVTITDVNGCTTVENATVNEPDSVTITVTPDVAEVNLGDELALQAATNQGGSITYNWVPASGLSCSDCEAPTFSDNYSRTYTVTATTQDGCMGTTSVKITVIPNYNIFIPNAFTPNGDGANDYWNIFGNIPGIKQLHVMVFNRIGEKVFETNDIDFKWDGTYKGKPAPNGVYTYVSSFVWLNNHSDSHYNGTVTIVR